MFGKCPVARHNYVCVELSYPCMSVELCMELSVGVNDYIGDEEVQ